MPVFDFKCINCDTVTEMRQLDDLPFPTCEKCGNTLAKVYTPPSVHFKGGGWGGQ